MRIRVIKKKDEYSLEYKIGDEFTVTGTWYGGVNVNSNTGIPLSLEEEEYEVIEEKGKVLADETVKLEEPRKEDGQKHKLKVLLLNGSAKANGCTYTALLEVAHSLEQEGIDWEIFQVGAKAIRDCIGCGKCNENGCVFEDDLVNEFVKKAREADGFIFGTPVYYAHPSGRILAFLDRAFYSSKYVFMHKPGACVASARRAGTSASLDVIQKYFGISSMPIVGSTYWNMVHGNQASEVLEDKEGLQTMRNLGKNMAWLLKCIEIGIQHGIDVPNEEKQEVTNFIR